MDFIRRMIEADGRRPTAITVSELLYDRLEAEWTGYIEDPISIFGIQVYWCKDLVGVDVEYAQ